MSGCIVASSSGVLLSLDDVLARRRCYIGVGTAIALAHGEFRESVDIDFLIADADGYRGLRGVLLAARVLEPPDSRPRGSGRGVRWAMAAVSCI